MGYEFFPCVIWHPPVCSIWSPYWSLPLSLANLEAKQWIHCTLTSYWIYSSEMHRLQTFSQAMSSVAGEWPYSCLPVPFVSWGTVQCVEVWSWVHYLLEPARTVTSHSTPGINVQSCPFKCVHNITRWCEMAPFLKTRVRKFISSSICSWMQKWINLRGPST
jgi:hypothetical protein